MPGVRGRCDRNRLLASSIDAITYRGPAARVKFELWDDERKLAESRAVPAGGRLEATRYRRFVTFRSPLALRRLRGERPVGSISIKRRPA